MSCQAYKWKRFWYPREEKISLADHGYPHDPDSEHGRFLSPNVVPFDSIVNFSCLILLGEPGIGKTTAINQAFEEVTKTGEICLKFDLGEYQTDFRLCSEVFGNETFRSWLSGTHKLHLFLDSLDEGRLAISNLAKILASELKRYPCDRLFLRIACRTAEWPNVLEENLNQLWKDKEAVQVYKLAPLRRVDVIEAAGAKSLNSDVFLQEIQNKEVVPLAIKPVTLKFLLDTYSRDGKLPSTQKELYFKGCRRLCEETNKDRRDAKLTGVLTIDQRMIVAARIAAVTIFCNRTAVWTGIDQDNVPGADITFRELCGATENINGYEFAVNENEVKEALTTGLFSSHGSHRLGWSHQTYAEFLAAWYLEQHQITIAQINSLIVHPNDPNGKLVPQLHEVAAWLAGMLPAVFREIMKADPDILLQSDVATAEEKDREALVENLLKLYDEEKLLNRYLDNYRRYHKLNHSGAIEQLRPYIRDANKSFVTRTVAIDIVEVCDLQALQDDLVDVALDNSQPPQLRVSAASAICKMGNEEGKLKLKPLAIGKAGDDPHDELKGYGLQAVWPTYMTVEELFAVLTPPKQANFYRAYQGFLHDLAKYLQPDHLPIALQWVEQSPVNHSFEELADSIMLRAWEHLELPGILEVFARIALSRLKKFEKIIGEQSFVTVLNNDDKKRRRLVKKLVSILPSSNIPPIRLLSYRMPVVLCKDVSWMIERLEASETEQFQQIWADLIWRSFSRYELKQVEVILTACQNNPVLNKVFTALIKPIELNSPTAQKLKADYLEEQEWQKRDSKKSLLKPPPKQQIIALLDEFESGNLAAWWYICMEMTLKPDSSRYGSISEVDLANLSGWSTADNETRARIIEAAKRYILEQKPIADYLSLKTRYESDLVGYKALRLLWQEAPSFVSTISVDVWKKWAPFILDFSSSKSTKEEPDYHLLKIAYQHAPTEIINTLILLVNQENEQFSQVFIIDKVKAFWDNKLEAALLAKVKDKKLKLKSLSCLLEVLLEHKVKEAEMFTKSSIGAPPPFSGYRRAKAIVAAWTLINYAEDAGWSVVWPAIQRDYKFGRKVVETASYFDSRVANVGRALSEKELADLYLWLVQQYPYAEDPKHDGVYSPGPRDNIARWRDSILRHLLERGTSQACEEIQRIIRELPELDQLKTLLLEAQTLVRRRTWKPFQPSEIIKLVSNQRLRLVQSGSQLLDVIIESLNRLQETLQGETPAVIDLWNEVKWTQTRSSADSLLKRFETDLQTLPPTNLWNGINWKSVNGSSYTPKDENRLSDYIKRHLNKDLKQRGVIVNREVEIRRGELTDIHVTAFVQNPKGEAYNSVTVIIEVKGCWNQELKYAMETQLVGRYLKDNNICQHGLYLIGWFNCDQWDDSDYRKQKAGKLSLEQAQQEYSSLAVELSQQSIQVKAFIINTALR